jgi:hypothetical protein
MVGEIETVVSGAISKREYYTQNNGVKIPGEQLCSYSRHRVDEKA